jgi:hypothetical protein
MNGWHEENLFRPLWQKVHYEFGVGGNALDGFVQRFPCNTELAASLNTVKS